MKKTDNELLLALFELTELNIKRIERFSLQYASPVVNEYRYALGHLLGAMDGNNGEGDKRKALAHLRKAYYDSCDILLDWLICSGRDYFENLSEIKGLSAISGIDEEGYRQALKDAKQVRFAPDEPRAARVEERYADISKLTDKLCAYQNTIRERRFSLLEESERYWRKRRRELFFKIITGVVSVVAAALAIVLQFLGR